MAQALNVPGSWPQHDGEASAVLAGRKIQDGLEELAYEADERHAASPSSAAMRDYSCEVDYDLTGSDPAARHASDPSTTDREQVVKPKPVENWAILSTFVATVLGLFAYLGASIAGWIDWFLWAPILIADLCVAWLSAMRISRSDEDSSLTR